MLKVTPLEGWATHPWLGLVVARFKGRPLASAWSIAAAQCPMGPAEALAKTASQRATTPSAQPCLPQPSTCSPECLSVNLPQANLCPGTCFQGARPKAFHNQEACFKAAFVCRVGIGSQTEPSFQMGRLRPRERRNLSNSPWFRGRS